MTDLFEENDNELVDVVGFDEMDLEGEPEEVNNNGVNPRIKLENKLAEMRLKYELEDFIDY